MVSFTPNEEQEMLVGTIRRYAAEFQKQAHENDERGSISHDLILKGWEIGLLPASIPEAWGGFGDYSAVTNVLAMEELAYGDLAAAIKLIVPSLFALPVLWHGTDEQKARFLPLFCEEKPYPSTAAFIEARIQFDPLEMATTATADGDSYILNGEKAYVPLAEGAEWMIVYARDTESGSVDGYLVECNAAEGLNLERREKLMGINALDTYRVKLNQVRVGTGCKIGGETGTHFQDILNHSYVGLAAMAVGVARASHEYALEYSKNRIQFGKPIATKQAIAFMQAESRIEVDAARLMVWDAAWQIDAGKSENDITKAAYLAK
ncbi:MAG TPA: acyl-CoA dehydrogenase family protein, partial [Aggregatilineales bacterium]|nr:acyl-CoA dehydrogenase family protein [Aggregatilineales bacterium]